MSGHPLTVGAASTRYVMQRWDRQEISKETRRSFRETLRLFAETVGHDRLLDQVKPRNLDVWIKGMANRQVAAATIRLRIGTVKGFFRWAVLEGHAKKDPTIGLRLPKPVRTVPRSLSDDQIALALERCVDARERLIVLLMREEGLRAIEVANLQMGDIDMAARTMVVKGKGGHSRVLPVTSTMMGALSSFLTERGRDSGALIQSYQRSYASDNDGLSAKVVARFASEAIKRSGVKESGHALRHTFAHRMIDAGASIRDVQLALGHASIVTTQVYLGHAALGDLRGFMEGGAAA